MNERSYAHVFDCWVRLVFEERPFPPCCLAEAEVEVADQQTTNALAVLLEGGGGGDVSHCCSLAVWWW